MTGASESSSGAMGVGSLVLVLLSGAPFAAVASADVTDASVRFRVESQQGPAVTFEAETPYVRAPGSQPEATIGVKKGRRQAIYGTERAALVTPHQVRADFGRFGTIAVQFRATSKRVRRPSGCRRTISSPGQVTGASVLHHR